MHEDNAFRCCSSPKPKQDSKEAPEAVKRVTLTATFHVKKDFAGVIKLRFLRQEIYSGLSVWALNVIISILIRGRQRKIKL